MSEQDVCLDERLRERHAVLEVDVLVRGAVDEEEAGFPLEELGAHLGEVGLLVALPVVGGVGQAHEAFRVGGVWKK